MYSRRAIALGGAAFLAGCYNVTQTESGRIVRVNTVTGTVDEVVDGRLVRAQTPAEIERERANRSPDEVALATRRDWEAITLPIDGGTSVRLSTKFDTTMMYILTVGKDWRTQPGRSFASINLSMSDADGFEVGSQRILLSEMVSLVGADQASFALEHRGRLPINADQYAQLANYTITWAGFGA